MHFQVYKSLDKPSSLFGLKGSYLTICIAGVGIGVVPAGIVGSLTNGFFGFIIFIGFAAAAYFATLRFQSKFSERERTKWLACRNLPDYIKVPPRKLSSYANIEFKQKKKGAS